MTRIVLSLSSIISALLLMDVSATNRHMICKDVESVFEQNQSGNNQVRGAVGPPGKMGPPGPKGEQGMRGDPGTVDMAAMEAMIEEKVNAKLTKELADIHEAIRRLNNSQKPKEVEKNQNTNTNTRDCPQTNAIAYNNKCYWLVLRDNANVNYAKAVPLCTNSGGHPADILSLEHFNAVKASFVSTRTKWFWLGMRINPSTKTVTFSTGARAPFTKWYRGWPQSTSTSTQMTIQFNVPFVSTDGMFHMNPTANSHGILCQD